MSAGRSWVSESPVRAAPSHIRFRATRPGQLFMRRLGDVDAHAHPAGTGAFSFMFSPDGKKVAMRGRDGKVRLLPLDGGPASTISEVPTFFAGLAWADNHTLVLGSVAPDNGIGVLDVAGGSPRQVTKPQ